MIFFDFVFFKVIYDVDGFLERNCDKLSQDLVGCLLNSNNNFIKDLFIVLILEIGIILE